MLAKINRIGKIAKAGSGNHHCRINARLDQTLKRGFALAMTNRQCLAGCPERGKPTNASGKKMFGKIVI